ncbi:amino acid/amide ABC transporter membrane protein 1, HAAT family [Fervidobacterium changbaicum]|uniref:Branched-chain amino acid ABC transporter permease n=2 Tax=Fervidobacterium TaxID=2422 RepID=A0AAI8CL02_FERIS|nr:MULTISPECIES: branched-chain amino acid ABC transporter permease [Fervidobacterium]AMW32440.1 branched-chain amino acid ABC transporter permease [Fervidobacterium islandicum]QAV33981.1 branched-chain amino acid ABC transporter permease [Fervidobacterium changbaicum]SDH25617.1 amino acid/amide ABC transporter membrane protein 1, HAAT family [Fervidobacterium changbaicum]
MINQILLGLSTGAIYSLVAIGLVMMYKVSGVMNFAYGNMGMFVTYVIWWLSSSAGLNLYFSIAIGIIFAAIMGIAVERYGLRPIRHLSHASMLIVTFGILMILEGLAVEIWGTQYKAFPEIVTGTPFVIRGDFGIVVIRRQDILVFSILAIISLLLALFTKFTKFGIAVRAVSENEEVAGYMGINVGSVLAFSWAFGTAMAAIVGVISAPKVFVSPTMLTFYQIQGFTAAVLGGFETFTGAVLGGLLLGVLEKIVGNYISEGFKASFSLVIIVLVLIFFPNGLFGRRLRRRA